MLRFPPLDNFIPFNVKCFGVDLCLLYEMLNVWVMVSVLVDNDGSERDVHDEAHGHFRFRPAGRRGPRARAAGQVRIFTRLFTLGIYNA